ncbi:MAG TPA: hypothetical protein VK978_02035 [Candidatus Saccharimonadales bacterium]|nr:hypothetical protein [Candidatus Saccharimonadales bacterium]
MTKQIIAFDIDDVLADSTEYWRVQINRRAGLQLEPEHWRVSGEYSGYYTRIWEEHGISHVFSVDEIDAQMETDQSGLRAMPEALEVLSKLSKHYTLAVVTARNSSQEQETRRWLSTVYPTIFDTVIFANGSRGLAVKNKGDICREIGASWLIDDNPGHCKDALDKGVQAVLYGTYGWHVDVPTDMVHCRTWQDIEEYFDAIAAT